MRDRYNAFIDRHEVAWELGMAAVTVVWLIVSFAGDGSSAPVLLGVEWALTGVLAAEFLTRLGASRDRRAYLRSHWIDAVALVPPARGLRLLRLIRLLRLVRLFAGVYRSLVAVEAFATNRRLVLLFVSWLAVAVICSAGLYLAEANVNPDITDPLDALWWGVVTLTTVGYGDVFPVTQEGRLAALGLMLLGITLFAAITGTITSQLIAQDPAPQPSADRLRELVALRDDGLITEEEFERKRSTIVDLL